MSNKFDVYCDLPNASDSISGVAFDWCEKSAQRVARDLTADEAAKFKGIPGYVLADAKGGAPKETATEKKARERREAEEAEAEKKRKAEAAAAAGAGGDGEATEQNPAQTGDQTPAQTEG